MKMNPTQNFEINLMDFFLFKISYNSSRVLPSMKQKKKYILSQHLPEYILQKG